jgi:hypothetical protein
MGQSDLLVHAGECERALHIATDAEHRKGLKRLRNAWLLLADDQRRARDPHMQEAISVLRRLHVEIAAVRATLH